MLQCLDERNFFLNVLVFALGLGHVSNIQLDHLHRYQLAGVRQPAPDLQVNRRASAQRGNNEPHEIDACLRLPRASPTASDLCSG